MLDGKRSSLCKFELLIFLSYTAGSKIVEPSSIGIRIVQTEVEDKEAGRLSHKLAQLGDRPAFLSAMIQNMWSGSIVVPCPPKRFTKRRRRD